MKLSLFGRLTMASLASVALGLGMTACGGGTIGYMWVLGQQYNQIAGFKIDDYTGNLTAVPTSPFNSGGSNPVSIVLKAGGRFLYVINQGVAPSGGLGSGPNVGQSVDEFAVGGDGTLTYQDSYSTQGYDSQWAQMDASGTYLYVLDKYQPTISSTGVYGPNTNGLGSITVFAADPNTGRLSLVTNSQTQGGAVNTTFWNVGSAPFMMKAAGSCLLTINAADQSVSPFQIGAGGQLIYESTGTQAIKASFTSSGGLVPAISATSINGNSSYIYITDSNKGSATNYVYPFTLQSNCNLNPVTGGAVTNFSGAVNPQYSLLDNSGKYLYVLNQSDTNTSSAVPFSSISAWTLNAATGQLQAISGAPFTTGSGPVCMAEDVSNQYIYISGNGSTTGTAGSASTITGKVIDPTTGNLSDLSRGATFTTVGQASCLVISGAVN